MPKITKQSLRPVKAKTGGIADRIQEAFQQKPSPLPDRERSVLEIAVNQPIREGEGWKYELAVFLRSLTVLAVTTTEKVKESK